MLRELTHLFILEICKGTSLDAVAWGGLADLLRTQRADFLQAAEHRGGHAVRGLLAPGLQDLGYFRWIAGTQITERVHSRQLDAPRDICKEFSDQSLHKNTLVIQNVRVVLHQVTPPIQDTLPAMKSRTEKPRDEKLN